MTHRTEFGFARTSCDCPACSKHCRFMPGMLVPSDLNRMCPPNQDVFEWAKSNLLASPGALVAKNGQMFRIHTLVPARNQSGACKFLATDGRCEVHAIAPYGCAMLDSHMGPGEGSARSSAALVEIYRAWQANGLYAQAWNVLNEIGKVAPSPEACRAQAAMSQR